MGQYCLLMGIRVVCIFAIFVTPRPWAWLWVLGAVVLPYVAVTVANAAGEKRKVDLNIVPKRQRTGLTSGPVRSPDGHGSAHVPQDNHRVGDQTTTDPAPAGPHADRKRSGTAHIGRLEEAVSEGCPQHRDLKAAANNTTSQTEDSPADNLVLRGEVIHD